MAHSSSKKSQEVVEVTAKSGDRVRLSCYENNFDFNSQYLDDEVRVREPGSLFDYRNGNRRKVRD